MTYVEFLATAAGKEWKEKFLGEKTSGDIPEAVIHFLRAYEKARFAEKGRARRLQDLPVKEGQLAVYGDNAWWLVERRASFLAAKTPPVFRKAKYNQELQLWEWARGCFSPKLSWELINSACSQLPYLGR